jgi:hypothetical protein
MFLCRVSRTGILASCIVALVGMPRVAQAVDAAILFKQIQPYVVGVSARGGGGQVVKSGSGVIVGLNEILTNCHVIERLSDLSVEFSDGETATAVPSGRLGKVDLCTLSAKTGARKFPAVSPMSSVKVGQKVYALGNPLSLTETFSDGLISGIRKRDGQTVVQTTAPVSPGSSGGGLFDSAGRLVGITTFTLVRGQNVNFAIPAENLKSLRAEKLKESKLASESRLTFKGVPFGVAVDTFKASFPAANCRPVGDEIYCYGTAIEYLGRVGQYRATFFRDRLGYVDFRWEAGRGEDPKAVAKEIQARIEKYFGPPTQDGWAELKDEQGGIVGWKVSPDQAIGLGFCLDESFFCQIIGANVQLSDDRYWGVTH